MNRRKFERFAVEHMLPLDRLDNDSRYTSMETEWAWRGYCEKAEETRIASSTVNHLCNRAKPFMTRRNVGRFRQVIKDTVLTDGLVPTGWEILPEDLRTHFDDIKEAVTAKAQDEYNTYPDDGYWAHQLKVIEKIEKIEKQLQENTNENDQ